MTEKNAIILAAGKSNRFAPFTYEKPKGLLSVKGDILIERQIKHLREAGVNDIYVVVGYMKEKFYYLEQKFGVKIIINNDFDKGNLYSLSKAAKYLNNTYICYADNYFERNIFLDEKEYNGESYQTIVHVDGKYREFSVSTSDINVITAIDMGGENGNVMRGYTYFNESFSKKFNELLDKEIDDFGVSNMFWEEFYSKHIKEITLFAKQIEPNIIYEFDSIDDLRNFDNDFFNNVDSNIINNICVTLKCGPNDINNISVISAGFTNVSFIFEVKGVKYVYRNPGGYSDEIISRKAEIFAQAEAAKLNIDDSVIKLDETGWKISYLIENVRNCNLDDEEEFVKSIQLIKKMHEGASVAPSDVKKFDTLAEGKRLLKKASFAKGNLFEEFNEVIKKSEKLDNLLKKSAIDLGLKSVICHNDTYTPNFLINDDGRVYLIDWEYAGVNDPANDIGCILCRGNYSEEQVELCLETYFGRKLNEKEERHFKAYIALSAFYWLCWGLYKDSIGDDDGGISILAYRNFMRYIDKALKSFE